jgi:hypothetical protein
MTVKEAMGWLPLFNSDKIKIKDKEVSSIIPLHLDNSKLIMRVTLSS